MKGKVKDIKKKAIVEEYQRQLRESIDRLLSSEERKTAQRKAYIEALEGNLKRAPYVLGYLEWPDEKKKK
jgi:hypothetical protein